MPSLTHLPRTFLFSLSALILPMAAQAAVADPASFLADFAKVADTPWPKNRMLTVVCHGHSVPSGYFKTPQVDTFNAYPHLLHQQIKAAYPFAVVNVTVTAIGGEQSVSGAARFARDVLSLRPDVVTIDYALNDRRIGLEAARKAWVSMIKAAQEAGIKVILLTPTGDLSSKLDDAKDPLNQHAAQIRQLAEEYQTGLVDSLALFKEHIAKGGKLDELMSQVNHPNRQGHDLVAGELAKWFTSPKAKGK